MFRSVQSLKGAKVLVVEDDALSGLYYADELEEDGAEVIGPYKTARDALAALEAAAIDVAVIDFVLEDRNSAALQEALEDKRVPFVIVTGYPPVLVRRHPQQTVLPKPLPSGKLCSTLRAACIARDGKPASGPGGL